MKLRNLMYATMIACAFASCSKDDVPNPDNGGDPEANATLEVKIDRTSTKAMGVTPKNEDAINSLQLLVFNPNNGGSGYTLEAIGTAEGKVGPELSVKTLSIKPGNKRVVVLANTDEIKTLLPVGSSYSDLLTKTISFGTEKDGLTMNSKYYDVTVVASKGNFMGYGAQANTETENYIPNATETVKLYRNVAKVILNSAKLQVKNDAQYKKASLTLEKVFIVHAHKNTKVVGADAAEWGAINEKDAYLYAVPAVNQDYAAWIAYMTGKNEVYEYITNGTGVEADVDYVQDLAGNALVSADAKTFYTYENTEKNKEDGNYNTLLVVQATFSFTGIGSAGQDTLYTAANRYYPVAVGYGVSSMDIPFSDLRTGVDAVSETNPGVLRNVKYAVDLTISGPGYKTPFGPKPEGTDPDDPTGGGEGGDTFLDAQIEVVAFGTVTQVPDVE